MSERMSLRVDGAEHVVEVDPAKPLLYTLRNDIGLNNPRFGCGLGQCGACTAEINGVAMRTCSVPTSLAKGAQVTTIASLGTPDRPHPIQTAYIEEQVPQCGYCSNGFMLAAAALLKANPHPSDEQIRAALTGLKCRCGTHLAIIRAVKRAAAIMAAGSAS